jgi:hypothetical protein
VYFPSFVIFGILMEKNRTVKLAAALRISSLEGLVRLPSREKVATWILARWEKPEGQEKNRNLSNLLRPYFFPRDLDFMPWRYPELRRRDFSNG